MDRRWVNQMYTPSSDEMGKQLSSGYRPRTSTAARAAISHLMDLCESVP